MKQPAAVAAAALDAPGGAVAKTAGAQAVSSVVLGGGNDLGGGRGVAWLDRALRGTAGALHGLEERVRAAAQRAGAAERRTRRDPVRAHVREAGHSHYRGQFPAGQRAGGTRAWHPSGS